MKHGYYSPFWLGGGMLTSPEWHARDDEDPRWRRLEAMRMDAWLRLPDVTHRAVIAAYAPSRREARQQAKD